MPAYRTFGSITALYQGDTGLFYNNEVPVVGVASEQFALAPAIGTNAMSGSIEIDFAADPGAFQMDLQTSDTDVDADYVTKASLNGGLNAAFTARMEIGSPFVAKFWRLKPVTLTNAVACVAKGTKG